MMKVTNMLFITSVTISLILRHVMLLLRSWLWLLFRLFNAFNIIFSSTLQLWFPSVTPWPTFWLVSYLGASIPSEFSSSRNSIWFSLLPNPRNHLYSLSWFTLFPLLLFLLVRMSNSHTRLFFLLALSILGIVISSCISKHPPSSQRWSMMIIDTFDINPILTASLEILYTALLLIQFLIDV